MPDAPHPAATHTPAEPGAFAAAIQSGAPLGYASLTDWPAGTSGDSSSLGSQNGGPEGPGTQFPGSHSTILQPLPDLSDDDQHLLDRFHDLHFNHAALMKKERLSAAEVCEWAARAQAHIEQLLYLSRVSLEADHDQSRRLALDVLRKFARDDRADPVERRRAASALLRSLGTPFYMAARRPHRAPIPSQSARKTPARQPQPPPPLPEPEHGPDLTQTPFEVAYQAFAAIQSRDEQDLADFAEYLAPGATLASRPLDRDNPRSLLDAFDAAGLSGIDDIHTEFGDGADAASDASRCANVVFEDDRPPARLRVTMTRSPDSPVPHAWLIAAIDPVGGPVTLADPADLIYLDHDPDDTG